MKTIAFYNEKGDVGKSSYTVLYASYLYYKHGIDVAVVDLNNRLSGARAKEIKEKTINGTIDSFNLGKIWPIVEPKIDELKKLRGQNFPESIWFDEQIRTGQLKDKKVVLVDLPGAAGSDSNVASMLWGQHIGLYVMPTERNIQTIRATVGVSNAINRHAKHNPLVVTFINRVDIQQVGKKIYENIADKFKALRIPVLPDMISASVRMDNSKNKKIICSTLEYPNWDDNAFKGSRDLGIENLFIDITKLLNKSQDHRNTNPVYLDFVDSLQKEFNEKRQLHGTVFSEFEFPASMFKDSNTKDKTDSVKPE